MLGIIVALKHEAEHVIEQLKNKKAIIIADKIAYTGVLGNKDVVIVICGIGKVNSALATQIVIDKFAPTAIINFGTAGGFAEQVSALSYYTVDKCCQYDFDLSELDGVPVGYMQDYDTVFFQLSDVPNGLSKTSLASADRFTDKPEFISIIKQTGAALRDMEGGAIAQVCKANGDIPFISVKGVTDVYGSGASGEQFKDNLIKVCKGFPEIIIKTVNALV